ncbi:MAG: YckD family protein [Candidatus Bipolaricaulota bacterium]|nr:YckD family protein [Candidatus Bipolaricaulota bacterium]
MRKRTVLALALVGLVVLGTVGYVVYAQTAGAQAARKTFLARVAEKLGVTEDALLTALYTARAEMIDEAVAEGKLTQAQADYLKAVLKAKLEYYKAEGYAKAPDFGFGLGPRGWGRGPSRGWGRGLCPCPKAPADTGQ